MLALIIIEHMKYLYKGEQVIDVFEEYKKRCLKVHVILAYTIYEYQLYEFY